MDEAQIAPIPDFLLQLILKQSASSERRPSDNANSGNVKYSVQPTRVQEHFAGLWEKAGLEFQPGAGDRFYSCPLHSETNPSMHIDAQRCIWNCLCPECPGHNGAGVRELEALVGACELGILPAGLVFHVPPQSDPGVASELRSNPYPNTDAANVDPYLEELISKAKELFPLPQGQQPKVTSRFCAFTDDPSHLMRHQVISNSWNHPANRAIKRRQIWVHLIHHFSLSAVDVLYGISISPEEWNDRKRESMAAQVNRRGGQYAAFDIRTVANVVRFLTNVPIPGAVKVEDIDTTLTEAMTDLDLPESAGQQQRVHLVWLSQGWSLPSHKSKGTVKTIAYKRDVDPVDDAKEEEVARQMGLETWQGGESGDLEQWGNPRYFAVPRERVAGSSPERALDELLEFAQRLGYQPVPGIRSELFPNKSETREGE